MADRSSLPFVQLEQFQGLHTKVVPNLLQGNQLRTSTNTDYFRKYQGVSKLKGASRVLSSIYQEVAVTKKITSVMFYNYPDFDGQLNRQTIIAAGSTLQKVNSDGSLTSLKTGQTSELNRLDRDSYKT